MTPRNIISFIAKLIYQQEYFILRDKIIYEYKQILPKKENIHNRTLVKLLISGEDHRFRYHFGFDVIAILRAIKNRILYNKMEGASTIEQQLVRVLTKDFNMTLKRKIKEVFLSTTLCELVPRKEIPTIYLYVAYYGTEMNGLDEVFKKLNIDEAKSLSNDKYAEIIARIKYPEPLYNGVNKLMQINMRKDHLLFLYNKHSSYKIFNIYG